MDIIAKLFYSLFYIGLGLAILKYRKQVKGWTGNFMWAEEYIGRGGTYPVIIIIALGLIFYGAIYSFGGADLLISNK